MTTQFANQKEITSRDRLSNTLRYTLGQDVVAYFDDPQVAAIMVNLDGSLWIEKLGKKRINTGLKIEPVKAKQIFWLMFSSMLHLEGEIPECDLHFEGTIPPAVIAPIFTFRKKETEV